MNDQFYMVLDGDARKECGALKESLEASGLPGMVHCVITSPPYWKQRKYGKDKLELGNERKVGDYAKNLADIFDSIPLHPLGSVWVNLGDKRMHGLALAPERFAIEMVDRGWKLMDKVVWTKSIVIPNKGKCLGHCMIEPAIDRLNGNGWEIFYRFAKGKKPWSDTCSIRMPRENVMAEPYMPPEAMETITSINGRHRPNAWQIKMGQTYEKHYAVFPPMLCEVPVAMTCPLFTSLDGNKLETRIVEFVEYDEKRAKRSFGKYHNEQVGNELSDKSGRQDTGRGYIPKMPETKGFTDVGPDTGRGIVLDPFCGTGTVGQVALRMGRSFVGMELYEWNAEISKVKCRRELDMARDVNFRAGRI